MGSRGDEPHYVYGFRKRRNASRQGCEYRDNRCKFSPCQVPIKSALNTFTGCFSRARVRGEAQTAGTGTGGRESETEGGRKGESANVVGVLFLAVASGSAIVDTLTPADSARNRDDTTSQRP